MLSTRLAAATAVLAMSAVPLAAQTPAPAGEPPDGSPFVVVEGLAKEDLLNIRAAASPVGKALGRLPNGAVLRNFGCREFDGYKWCEVEAVDGVGLKGWTPSRYLFATNAPEGVASAQPAVDSPAAVEPLNTPASDGVSAAGAAPGPAPADEREMAAAADGPAAPASEPVAERPAFPPAGTAAAPAQANPAPDLSARMGGEAGPPLALESLQRSAATSGEFPAEPGQASAPAARGVELVGGQEPVAVADAIAAAPAEAIPAAQLVPANTPPPAPRTAEPAPAPPASSILYDGFLLHGVILWIVAAVAALMFGLL